jgi:hypothetical protein
VERSDASELDRKGRAPESATAGRRSKLAFVPALVPIDHYALFDDVVAVAKKAHAATAGWRAICVRAQRTVGKRVVQPLAELDLDEELPALADRVHGIARRAPSDIDTLVFGLFDGVDDDGAGVFTGFYVGGITGFDPEARWLLHTPSWLPDERFLKSEALDAIARASVNARGEAKKAVAHALRFGAAALLGRFAAEGLPYRVVVAFDEGDFAEITEGGSAVVVAASARPSLSDV